METPGFRLHPEAAADISQIWEFIARDSISAAGRVRTELLDTIRDLARFPYIGHRRTDLTSQPLRFHAVRNYLIAYAPEEKPLLVLAILHGRRSPRMIATLIRSRA